ncbi:MAG: hypothetical protein A2516_01100 [Alphaproteobacteria bacterium RIFOXYD12_FULL_60_8]|nr:MAG: hypothetical protein A2516_01100 [Alphaproteobacteria bacterium RIFOXYD12_FULL_60_8]
MRGLAVALVALLLLPGVAVAQSTADVIVDTVLTEVEKRVVRDYYAASSDKMAAESEDKTGKKSKVNGGKEKGGGLPPGLAKRDTLPPGLAKRQTLPPGLAKSALPDALRNKLPTRTAKHEIATVDNSVVLIERGTGIVLDVLENVIKGASNP